MADPDFGDNFDKDNAEDRSLLVDKVYRHFLFGAMNQEVAATMEESAVLEEVSREANRLVDDLLSE